MRGTGVDSNPMITARRSPSRPVNSFFLVVPWHRGGPQLGRQRLGFRGRGPSCQHASYNDSRRTLTLDSPVWSGQVPSPPSETTL